MGKTRYTLGADGQLRDRDGNLFGRLTSIVVDVYAEEPRGLGGEEVSLPSVASSSDVSEGQTSLGGVGGDQIAEIWAHYQQVIPGANRQDRESKRTTVIRNALKVRSLAECLAAIDGLSRSSHHNGQNSSGKKYLGIQYALKGIDSEGNDERIDKMAAIAASADSGALAEFPSGARAIIRTRQRLVEDKLLHPGDADFAARAGDSESYLAETWGLRAYLDEQRRVQWARSTP